MEWTLTKRYRKGAFHFSQAVLPLLHSSTQTSPHPPSLIFTGATASVKGSARFAAFATMKFALRAMAQSLAREYGPEGVHVAHAVIDGVIDIPRTKAWDMGEDGKISPDAIADAYWWLSTQPKTAFTWEIDIRPGREKWSKACALRPCVRLDVVMSMISLKTAVRRSVEPET